MTDRIVVLTSACHIGEMAGIFTDAVWIGNPVSLPLRVEYRQPAGT